MLNFLSFLLFPFIDGKENILLRMLLLHGQWCYLSVLVLPFIGFSFVPNRRRPPSRVVVTPLHPTRLIRNQKPNNYYILLIYLYELLIHYFLFMYSMYVYYAH